MPKIIRLILCVALLFQSSVIFAFETDQYNLPTVPLADIGDEVSDYVEENMGKAIGKINAEIVEHQNCLKPNSKNTKCNSPEKAKAKLEYLRSEAAVVKEIYKPLGGGIPPFTNSGSWMDKHKFKGQPARFRSSFSDSIYKIVPSNYLTISDTVNLYGYEFGTDKIAHIFQQGYSYYKIYERAIARGLSPEEAGQKAFGYGKMTERTYYGYFASGVYSNGDLAANFIGMKFYQSLTKETKIGEKMRPAILVIQNGLWKFNESANLRENLLKPFISNHLNEALNPSVYFKLFWLDSYIRKTVKKQSCKEWRKHFPNQTQSDFANLTEDLKLWHGEDYGHKNSRHFITVANSCFIEQNKETEN